MKNTMILTQLPTSAPAIAPALTVAPAPATVWYHVQIAGDELITYPDGDNSLEFVVDGFKLELEESYLGLGHLEQIQAEAAKRHPDKVILDWWLCKPPANEF